MSRPELEVFEQLLQNHDWTYHFSDDNRAYIKGRDQAHKIRVTMERLKEMGYEAEAVKLYHEYRPEYL